MRDLLTRCLLAAAICVAPSVALAQTSDSTRVQVDTVSYTEEQAARGELVHKRICLECHETLDYRTDAFRAKWDNRPAFSLFDLLLTTMPDENPGSLPPADYADAIAYMLKLNGVPPGQKEIPVDADSLKNLLMSLPPRR